MKITYFEHCDVVNWGEVAKIFEVVDWGIRPADALERAFRQSASVRFAFDGEKLIGFGRTVDDGAFYGWIVDLVVLPEYQGKGIGTYLLKELETDLEFYITTMLTAAPGKSGFYEKLGWLKQTSTFIWPRSEAQKRAYTAPE
ncbi:GNAT family N-acetyltransferase [Aurantivibrio plasticivorans]